MIYDKSISFIVAGYNESNNVIPAVEEIWKILHENFQKFEIILINDGSKDETLNKMLECKNRFSEIEVIDNLVNLNFGASVLRGMKAAKNEYVVYDAFDLPLKPQTFVDKFLKIDADCDVMVFERERYPCTLWRKITSDINVILLRLLFPKLTKGTPILNFTQIYKRDIIDKIIPLARSPIFVWPELIFRAKLLNLKVCNEMTKPYIKDIRSGAFGHPHDIIWGIYEMLRFRIRLWAKKI